MERVESLLTTSNLGAYYFHGPFQNPLWACFLLLSVFAYPTAPSSFFSQSALSLGDLTYSNGFNCHLPKLQVDRTATWHIQLTLTARNPGSDTWRQTGHPNRPTRETWTVINPPSLTSIWLSDFKNSETWAWHCHSVLNKGGWCVQLVCQNMSYPQKI